MFSVPLCNCQGTWLLDCVVKSLFSQEFTKLFSKVAILFCFPTGSEWASVALYLCQHLVVSVFQVVVILTGESWYLFIVLICISMVVYDVSFHRLIYCLYVFFGAAAAKSLQSCPTLCDPIDSSPPGSPIPGILQARTLEWVAISFSSAGKWKGKVKSLSHVWLLATPWTAAYQPPPSMGFSRQEYWSGVPLPSPFFGEVFVKVFGSVFNWIAFLIVELWILCIF